MQETAQPRSLGNYNLLASLATGGMAKVYLALRAGPAGFNKLLVIKILRDDAPGGAEEGLSMFWDEARLAAQLVHPNIVHTYEVGENAGEYFLAMEYLDGQSYRNLAKRAAGRGPLALTEHLRILSESARGLHYAHQLKDFSGHPLGVVHRDVSPQNIFVTYDGQVKVLDFGIAKTRDAEHKTQVGVIKGKLDYMAPEQLRGDELDARADVFALGVMLWEAISGVSFAGGKQIPQVARLHARLAGQERKLQEVAPETPAALIEIVERAIAVDPAQRYADAAAFADAVDAYVASLRGTPPSAKSLAAVIGPLFEAERSAMHKLIEQQIAAVQRGGLADTTGALPRFSVGEPRSTSAQLLTDADERSRSGHTPAVALGSGAAKLKPARRSSALAVVAAAIAIGGALAWFTGSANEQASVTDGKPLPSALGAATPAERSAVDDVSTRSASVPVPHAGSVLVDLHVSPASAKVMLDGALLPQPFSGEFPRSAAVRRIEVTAPGYRPYSKLLAFDQNHRIEVALEPLTQFAQRRARATRVEREPPASASSAAQTSTASAAPQTAAPAKEFELAPGSDLALKPRVRRAEIDVADPYAL